MEPSQSQWVSIHPLVVRMTHWVNAFAILIMVTSGWRIYNASPLFPFRIPQRDSRSAAGSRARMQWHFAAMWLLVLNGTRLRDLRDRRRGTSAESSFRSPRPPVLHDVREALRGKLAHDDLSMYNAAQRAPPTSRSLFCLIGAGVHRAGDLEAGAVPRDRRSSWATTRARASLHFCAMALMVFIVLVHIAMVILVPRTFPTMITGRARRAS